MYDHFCHNENISFNIYKKKLLYIIISIEIFLVCSQEEEKNIAVSKCNKTLNPIDF